MTEDGMTCDDRKWVNEDGTQGSFFKHPGWKKGCGCVLSIKAKNPNKHCIIQLW